MRRGLNHLAFEMDTERVLVDALHRARDLGQPVERMFDHLISRSAYLHGPDDVHVELYADSTPAWRQLYEDLDSGLMTSRWELDDEFDPSETPHHPAELDHRPVPGAPVQPLRTARAAVVAADLDHAVGFYRSVLGLELLEADPGVGRWALLGGHLGLVDLLVLEQVADEPVGFHHVGLELADLAELEATEHRLRTSGIRIDRTVEHARKRSLVLRDPDGFAVELFTSLEADPELDHRAIATPALREFLA